MFLSDFRNSPTKSVKIRVENFGTFDIPHQLFKVREWNSRKKNLRKKIIKHVFQRFYKIHSQGR